MKTYLVIQLILLIILTLCGCKKDEEEVVMPEPVVFTRAPVDTMYLKTATPLGNMNPPGHTIPTDHIYFYLDGADFVPVYSIGGGTIKDVRYNEWSDDYNIYIEYSSSCGYYFDHIANIPPYISTDYELEAGVLLGYCETSQGAIDLGVIDNEVENYFIVPERYLDKNIHCANPYLYFTDSVRNILYEKNRRTKEPRGGKIDYDIDGRLSGNWFLDSIEVNVLNATHEYQDYQLVFACDLWDPDVILIAAGGTLKLAPFYSRVVDNTPDPKDVTVSSGLVKYELASYVASGTLLVQMVEDRKIKVEVFPDLQKDEVDNFTSNAKLYIR
jgi:hypothetical protein